MDMSGEQRIEAARERVWTALNDPDILKQCIPGCDEMEKLSDTEFTAKVTAKVGPVKARFAGSINLADLDPPESYTITGEGKGGAAGFAKGGARVRLVADGAITVLRYEVHASVGGKLAQLGTRLIDGTARKMADDFFTRFTAMVHEDVAAAAEPAAARPAVAIEPGAAFPPAQPDFDAAAIAATQRPDRADVPPKARYGSSPVDTSGAAAESPVQTRPAEAEAEPAERAAAAGPRPAEPATTPPAAKGLSPVVWITGLIVLVLLLILIFAA